MFFLTTLYTASMRSFSAWSVFCCGGQTRKRTMEDLYLGLDWKNWGENGRTAGDHLRGFGNRIWKHTHPQRKNSQAEVGHLHRALDSLQIAGRQQILHDLAIGTRMLLDVVQSGGEVGLDRRVLEGHLLMRRQNMTGQFSEFGHPRTCCSTTDQPTKKPNQPNKNN